MKKHISECTVYDIKKVYDTFNVDMSLTTIKDMLKNQNYIYQNQKKLIPPSWLKNQWKKAKHTNLEDSIFVWLNQKNTEKITINDRIITEKEKYFGFKLHITDF